MKPPATPTSEPERLRALAAYEILDTAAEPSFDGLVAIAAHMLDVPIALVSIVDETRQWFKARHGLDVAETPRVISFCGHVVADGETLVVPDTALDDRFRDNPLVTGGPRIRFYAGTPLRTPEGHVLGTLCAIDREPRVLDDRQRAVLELLGKQVENQLERHREHRRLEAQSARLATQEHFFQLTTDLLCTASADLHFVDLNSAWEQVLGWTPDELRARPFTTFVHPGDLAATQVEAGRLLRDSSNTVNFENRYQHKDGRWVPLSWSAIVHNGTFFATARDMSAYASKLTDLAASEALLRLSEHRLRTVLETMVEGVVLQDQNAAITMCNSSAERILGLTRDQMTGRTSIDPRWRSVHEDGEPFPGDTHPAVVTLRTGKPATNVIMGVHKPEGELSWITINARSIEGSTPEASPSVLCTFHDVSEEFAAKAALAAERTFLTTLLDNLHGDFIMVLGPDGRIERTFGMRKGPGTAPRKLAGESAGEVVDAAHAGPLQQAIGRCFAGETVQLAASCQSTQLELVLVPLRNERGSVARSLMIASDVTERNQMRERLTRHERLVTTGTLAAGVGHEINNPLSYIVVNLDLAIDELRALEGGSPSGRILDLVESLTEAREGAERIRKIVRGLRTFAREESVPVPMDPAGAIELSINMSMHELRQKATVVTELNPTPMALGDESRVSQVLVNLLVNAAQAFSTTDVDRNRVTVRTRVAEGERISIEVIDNGPGIPDDVLPRIFDPFFTTKPVGVGTGLGLSISNNLVTSLGGELLVRTRLGEGTTFQLLLLPVPDESTGVLRPEQRDVKRGRVLVVDDEPHVLSMMARLLKAEHDVVIMRDGREAAELLLAGRTFDVVFCDLMMPNMSGVQLYGRILASRPELAERVVFMTGGTLSDGMVRDFLDNVHNERIEKPFDPANVRAMARRYLGRSTNSTP